MSIKLVDELLTPTNHDLMRLVEARVDSGRAMTTIAAEIGVHVDDLCHWILSVYREPRKPKVYHRPSMPAIGFSQQETARWSASEDARRFAAWKKARDGAAATRRMLEAAGQ